MGGTAGKQESSNSYQAFQEGSGAGEGRRAAEHRVGGLDNRHVHQRRGWVRLGSLVQIFRCRGAVNSYTLLEGSQLHNMLLLSPSITAFALARCSIKKKTLQLGYAG